MFMRVLAVLWLCVLSVLYLPNLNLIVRFTAREALAGENCIAEFPKERMLGFGLFGVNVKMPD